MAWQTLNLKISGPIKDIRQNRNHWICPKCEGKELRISYHSCLTPKPTSKKPLEEEKEYLVLICDRCGDLIAFEGCTGECDENPKSKCEVCGKYFCCHCGITHDFNADNGVVELHYCQDHVPEWYQNR